MRDDCLLGLDQNIGIRTDLNGDNHCNGAVSPVIFCRTCAVMTGWPGIDDPAEIDLSAPHNRDSLNLKAGAEPYLK